MTIFLSGLALGGDIFHQPQQDHEAQQVTRANAGGPRQLPIRERVAARIAQFWR